MYFCHFVSNNKIKKLWLCDAGHAPFWEFFSGVMSGLCPGVCMPNLKFVSLAILKLLPFNSQNFTEWRDPGHAPFWNFFRGHIRIVHESMHAKFEVHSFSITELMAFNSQILSGHVTLATPPVTLFWHSGVIGHQGTSYELWTAIIGPHTMSVTEVFQHFNWKCIM